MNATFYIIIIFVILTGVCYYLYTYTSTLSFLHANINGTWSLNNPPTNTGSLLLINNHTITTGYYENGVFQPSGGSNTGTINYLFNTMSFPAQGTTPATTASFSYNKSASTLTLTVNASIASGQSATFYLYSS